MGVRAYKALQGRAGTHRDERYNQDVEMLQVIRFQHTIWHSLTLSTCCLMHAHYSGTVWCSCLERLEKETA